MQGNANRQGLSCAPRAPQPPGRARGLSSPCLAPPKALRASCSLWRGLPVEGHSLASIPRPWRSTVPAPGVAAYFPPHPPGLAGVDPYPLPGLVFTVQPDPSPDCGHGDTLGPGQLHALVPCHDRHLLAYLWLGMVSARAGCCVRAGAGHRPQKKPGRAGLVAVMGSGSGGGLIQILGHARLFAQYGKQPGGCRSNHVVVQFAPLLELGDGLQ